MVSFCIKVSLSRAIGTVKRGTMHDFVSETLRSFIREVTLCLCQYTYVHTFAYACIYITSITKTVVAGTENYQRQAPSLEATQTDLHIRHPQPQILM